jgi:hypothetical protein
MLFCCPLSQWWNTFNGVWIKVSLVSLYNLPTCHLKKSQGASVRSYCVHIAGRCMYLLWKASVTRVDVCTTFLGPFNSRCFPWRPVSRPLLTLGLNAGSMYPCLHRWASPFKPFAKRITSVCFFVNKRTNDKLPFARWSNCKRIKENRQSFRFPIEMAACNINIFIHTHTLRQKRN